ncbi:ribonuclease T2-like isoform 1-T2 [Pholidichthys leucotaenia]
MHRSLLPLLVSLSPALLFLLLLPHVTVTHQQWEDYKYGHQGPELDEQNKNQSCSWTCSVFTQQWPGGFCQSLDNGTHCRIPPNINSWTIHGLWPLRRMRCCDCWPMFHSDVQEVEAELNQYWPSLLKTKSSFYFWREEWRKHGVCAACVEGLNSPLRYFQQSLKLRGQFDVHRLLENANITPSCQRLYKVSEVHRVLAPHLGDQIEIQCVKDQKDRQVWFQVKTRLSRNFTVGCDDRDVGRGPFPPSPGHPCPPDVPFYFYPINHQQPRSPCD